MIQETTNYEVVAALVKVGVPPQSILVGDQFYALPKAEWVQSDFANWFSHILADLHIVYVEEKHDCEDFALLAAWCARRAHAKTPHSPVSGIAFGELWIVSLQHAINFAVHQASDGLAVVAYEPQLNSRGFSMQPRLLGLEDWTSVKCAKL